MPRSTPVFIVCSSRPRVGKTLLARVIVEYFRNENRTVAAFDANPGNFALVDHLPGHTAVATLNDVRGEMALFDQLVAPDLVPKVVDLEPGLFDRFFGVVQEIDFLRETRRNAIAPVALFLADPDPRSVHGYAVLRERMPDLPLLPVFNDALPGMFRCRDSFPAPPQGGTPLVIPPVSPVLKGVFERQGFSFADFIAQPYNRTSELFDWTGQMFAQLREIELRQLLADMKPTLEAELRRMARR